MFARSRSILSTSELRLVMIALLLQLTRLRLIGIESLCARRLPISPSQHAKAGVRLDHSTIATILTKALAPLLSQALTINLTDLTFIASHPATNLIYALALDSP